MTAAKLGATDTPGRMPATGLHPRGPCTRSRAAWATASLLLLLAGSARAQGELFPLTLPWDNARPSATDLATLSGWMSR